MGLKILVSVVRFRPGPPNIKPLINRLAAFSFLFIPRITHQFRHLPKKSVSKVSQERVSGDFGGFRGEDKGRF